MSYDMYSIDRDCRRCAYHGPPDPKGRNYNLGISVVSCRRVGSVENYKYTTPCLCFTPAKSSGRVETYSEHFKRLEDEKQLEEKKLALSELKKSSEQYRIKSAWLEETHYRMSQPPGDVVYRDPKPKGDSSMKIKRFIVRSFLRSFRHSLFILAFWKAAELARWAWPGLKMIGCMLYPPIYAVAHAVQVRIEGPDAVTTGDQVFAIWLGIIVTAAGAIVLLCAAWYFLNRLARAAFAEEQA